VLIDRTAMMLPHIKITELLVEVDEWTGFTRHFTHLKTGEAVKDTTALLTVILADGINLGLTKMAESCPGTSYAKLAWLQGWHVRDETRLPSSSTRSPGNRSQVTGATGRRLRRMDSASGPAGKPRAPVTSIRSTAANLADFSTRTSPTSTRRSASSW